MLYFFVLILVLSFISFSRQRSGLVVTNGLNPRPSVLVRVCRRLVAQGAGVTIRLGPGFKGATFLCRTLGTKDVSLCPRFAKAVASDLLGRPPPLNRSTHDMCRTTHSRVGVRSGLTCLRPVSCRGACTITIPHSCTRTGNLASVSSLRGMRGQTVTNFALRFGSERSKGHKLTSLCKLRLRMHAVRPTLHCRTVSRNVVRVASTCSASDRLGRCNLIPLRSSGRLFPPCRNTPLVERRALSTRPRLGRVLRRLSNHVARRRVDTVGCSIHIGGHGTHSITVRCLGGGNLV